MHSKSKRWDPFSLLYVEFPFSNYSSQSNHQLIFENSEQDLNEAERYPWYDFLTSSHLQMASIPNFLITSLDEDEYSDADLTSALGHSDMDHEPMQSWASQDRQTRGVIESLINKEQQKINSIRFLWRETASTLLEEFSSTESSRGSSVAEQGPFSSFRRTQSFDPSVRSDHADICGVVNAETIRTQKVKHWVSTISFIDL
ncbi:hypothetical protein O181_078184 [Austropuccinia psidii MF-1]|uniref:Uncharacterized protein n=1 Tax=Austropuccinia psidii MF-1 TaxID=1389203 RepID=A0A9Q3FG11_9BASI|nr:hypothetical protein [Austropuccinia psidii MF-1]